MTVIETITNSDRLASLALALRIEGIPTVFVEQARGGSYGASGVTEFECIAEDGVTEGKTSIDLDKRVEKSATLDVVLKDDEDRTLRGIFAHNARRSAYIAATTSAAATSITVNSTDGLTSPIYIGSETITFSGTSGGDTLTGCTRGAFGSTAAAYNGDATDGDSIYQKAPAWQGRRAYLYGTTLDAAGDVESYLLSTWMVDESPANDGGIPWLIRCGGLAGEFYRRALYVGVRPANGDGTFATISGNTATAIVDDASNFRVGSNWPTYVVVESEVEEGIVPAGLSGAGSIAIIPGVVAYNPGAASRISLHELTAVDTGAGTISFIVDSLFGTEPFAGIVKNARLAVAVGGPSGTAILLALLSRTGQGGSTYDRLPGREAADVNDFGWFTGGRFDAVEIDEGSFTRVTPPAFELFIAREIEVEDLLTEYAMITDSFTRVARDGQLTLVPLSVRDVDPFVIDEDVVDPTVEPTVTHDERSITPLMTVKANYDPLVDEFGVTLNFADVDSLKRYPRAPHRREVEFHMLHADFGGERVNAAAAMRAYRADATVRFEELQTGVINTIQRQDEGLGRRIVTLTCTFDAIEVEIGDVVTLASTLPSAYSGLPDFEGGTLAGKKCRVVGRRPDWSRCRLAFDLQVIEEMLVIPPAAVIASASGATLTLSTSGPEASAAPARDFWVGANVIVYDYDQMIAGGTASVQATVQSIPSDTQIVLTGALGFIVQSNVDYLVLDPYSSADGTSAAGYSLAEMATSVDDSGYAGAANEYDPVNPRPRWR